MFLLPLFTVAQTVGGKIVGRNNEPLVGATVVWVGTDRGVVTDDKGEFVLDAQNVTNKNLVVRYTGYVADTVNVANETFILHKLTETKSLDEVVITAKRDDAYISSVNPIKTEVISAQELTKAACCDLAGCFGGNASVQPTTTNVVTNSQELRILGLSGVYNQTLFDGMPLIQGLSYTYGVSSIPGPLVGNIYVAKGTTSVIQGYESISGQINVEPKEPGKSEKLFLNLYANSFLEKQGNAIFSTSIGKRKEWSNMVAVHTVQPANKIDRDGDNFLDLPLLTRYMVHDKIKYRDDKSFGFNTRIGLMYLDEERVGGQQHFNPATEQGSSTVYGQTVHIQQPAVYTKTGYRFNADNAITFIGSAFYQKQSAWFGQTAYLAEQQSAYANAQYEHRWKGKHDFKTGASFRSFDLTERVGFSDNPLNKTFAGNYSKHETVPGIFAENVFHWKDDKVSLITGVRADQHNRVGMRVTPRAMLRVQPNEQYTFRASVGTGWRTVNVFSENVNLLASQRDVVFTEALLPEEAINYGVNAVRTFTGVNVTGSLSADFYRTDFRNQIFPDYDTDPTKAFINNFTGLSASNGFQTDASFTFYKVFTVKASYNYLDVYRRVNGQKITLPFNPLHKVLTALSYEPKSEKWHVDLNGHWYGEQKLPVTASLSPENPMPERSKPYALVNAQFAKTWKRFEVYAGCENVFDFRQKQPIVSWENPFSPYFDTASVWGPTRGREAYVGIRYIIKLM